MFATHGFQVVGVDINERVVETLNNGEVHIHEPGLKTLVQAALKSGNLRVACEPEPADVFIIAVPTPLREGTGEQGSKGAEGNVALQKKADLSYVIAAAESIVPPPAPRQSGGAGIHRPAPHHCGGPRSHPGTLRPPGEQGC
jgi:UDP-N-acetyl-D-mannosaminuronic acid dehydrogenase